MTNKRFLGSEDYLYQLFGAFTDIATDYINKQLDEYGTCSLNDVYTYIHENYPEYIELLKQLGIGYPPYKSYLGDCYGWGCITNEKD